MAESVERTEMSRSGPLKLQRQWRLIPVAHLWRSAGIDAGCFEQELTEETESQSSVCSVTSCWFGTPDTFAQTLRICFRVFRGHINYAPSAMPHDPAPRFSQRVGLEIFE